MHSKLCCLNDRFSPLPSKKLREKTSRSSDELKSFLLFGPKSTKIVSIVSVLPPPLIFDKNYQQQFLNFICFFLLTPFLFPFFLQAIADFLLLKFQHSSAGMALIHFLLHFLQALIVYCRHFGISIFWVLIKLTHRILLISLFSSSSYRILASFLSLPFLSRPI